MNLYEVSRLDAQGVADVVLNFCQKKDGALLDAQIRETRLRALLKRALDAMADERHRPKLIEEIRKELES